MLGWFWLFAILSSWAVVIGLLAALCGLFGWTAGAEVYLGWARSCFLTSLFFLSLSVAMLIVSRSANAMHKVLESFTSRRIASGPARSHRMIPR